MTDSTSQHPKRITIDAPNEIVILAAQHLDAAEGRVQVGAVVDSSTRSAITTVLRYIATAHNSPAAETPTATDDVTHEEGAVPAGTPVPDFRQEQCPHCDKHIWLSQADEHVATAHADLPPCTATLDTDYRGTLLCVFRAGHKDGEFGKWHASAADAEDGRHLWNDTANGATPHDCPGIDDVVLSRHRGRGVVVEQAPRHARIALHLLLEAASRYIAVAPDVIEIADQVAYRITGWDPQQCALTLELMEDWRDTGSADATVGCVRRYEADLWQTEDTRTRPASAVCHEIANELRHILNNTHPTLSSDAAPSRVVTVDGTLTEDAAREAVRQLDADPHGLNAGMVVKPYTEHGARKWVFRCWGDDGCDGWLSLDHSSQQSAERARDRHVAEEHPSFAPDEPKEH